MMILENGQPSRLVVINKAQDGVYEIVREWDEQAQTWIDVSGERLTNTGEVNAAMEADE